VKITIEIRDSRGGPVNVKITLDPPPKEGDPMTLAAETAVKAMEAINDFLGQGEVIGVGARDGSEQQ
jgi:hypothetical protein